MAAKDFDAAVVGGPPGTSALAWVAKQAAEAQARMDGLAAAGKPFVPTYRKLASPAEDRRRALDAAMADDWQRMTLDTFNAYSPELRLAAIEVAEFIARPYGFLYLYGDVGTGKTHLAAGLAIRFVEGGYPVRVYRAADVANRLRTAVRQGEGAFETLVGRLKNVRVLVLDDFGAEHMTEFLAAEWYDILDYRYRTLGATIITANVGPEMLNMPRLESRFRDRDNARVVGLVARDYRTLKARPAPDVMADAFAPAAEPAATCEGCGGTGLVRRDLPMGHPDFGKAWPCPVCRGNGPALKNGGQ
jgi:DNA replication protein DnaC